MKSGDLDFYRHDGAMAAPGKYQNLFDALPDDVAGLARIVPGLMLHQHLSPLYGQTLTPERHAQAQMRSLEGMLAQIVEIDPRPLNEERSLDKRIIGVCRHFTLLMVAMLRAKGYAARSRCGFATYFEPGKFVDHWVAEYWHEGDKRWVMIDAQLDDVLKARFKFDFDPLDVPRDRFIVAGDAWHMAREGGTNPDLFGIMTFTGHWFIAGNVIRDIAALNKVEMLPWDVWGAMPEFGKPVPEDKCAIFDRLAAPTRDPDTPLDQLRALYDEARVPEEVFNSVTGKIETV